ncbi:hypothetical protein GRF59_20545 [Paenibacillus sp. HJL G12]|uniref:Uncharacterized protein n=1 Tax=Paenibacillus dendrobii TaxID=2691084 RepID=A0A7X3LID1_9BACL|nr:hypothetical protein [Paenibacillus dendrobii]MWV46012.1 hypothetical protein [Paenibacillus dendrobii]
MQGIQARRYSSWSWLALGIGIICLICVSGQLFQIIRGNFYSGLLLGLSSMAGFIMSTVGLMRRSEKKALLWIALVSSLSPVFYKIVIFVGFMSGSIPFAP